MSMTDLEMIEFGARLSELIKSKKLTQGEFAKLLHASPSFVSDLIRGVKKPGTDFLTRIKKQFNTSIDWLLYGEGSQQGNAKIKIELLKAIALRIELAKAALSGDIEVKSKLESIYPQIIDKIDTNFNFNYLIDNNQLDKDFTLLNQIYDDFIDEELNTDIYEKVMAKVINELSTKTSDPLLNL